MICLSITKDENKEILSDHLNDTYPSRIHLNDTYTYRISTLCKGQGISWQKEQQGGDKKSIRDSTSTPVKKGLKG